ncbi:TPA: DUF2339 domain-containing protein [Pseudomonas aeruginosa]|nr:DUF2339 domain-containing protein [Pseudomonas aeruginosa]
MQWIFMLVGLILGGFAGESLVGALLGGLSGLALGQAVSLQNLAQQNERLRKQMSEFAERFERGTEVIHQRLLRVERQAQDLPESVPEPAAGIDQPLADTPPAPPAEVAPPLDWDIELPAVEAAPPPPRPPEPVQPIERQPAFQPDALPAPRRAAPPAPPREPSLVERGFAAAKGWLFGGNTVLRIGVVLLFIGLAFLLRYASERVAVPVEYRYAGVALAAMALLGVGWWLRERRAAYGLILQGTGIAVLYLTIFAAMRLHPLISPGAALALLVVVTICSAILAVLQNAMGLAVVAALGGFAAPILTSTGSGNHVALFSYFALLNAGIFAIAWFRAWRPLNLVGFVGTFGIGFAWGLRSYTPELFASTEPFLALFFLMYVGIGLLFARRKLLEAAQAPAERGELLRWSARQADYIDATVLFGPPLVGFGLQCAVIDHIDFGMAFSALALGLFYMVLARVLRGHASAGRTSLLVEICLALGVVFGTLAIPLGLDARWTSAAWAVEGAGIYRLGLHQQRRLARLFALLLQGGAALAYLNGVRPGETTLLEGSPLGALMLGAAALFSFWQLRRTPAKALADWEPACRPLLAAAGLAFLYLVAPLCLAVDGTAIAWAVAGLASLFAGLRLGSRTFLFCAFAVQLLGGALFLLHLQGGDGQGGVFDSGWRGLMTASLIGLALIGGMLLAARDPLVKDDSRLLMGLSLVLLAGLAFVNLAVLFVLPWRSASAVWAGSGLLIIWLSLVLRQRLSFYFGLALQVVGGLAFLLAGPSLFGSLSGEGLRPLAHSGFWTPAVLALAALVGAWRLRRAGERERALGIGTLGLAELSHLLLLWGAGWWALTALCETVRFVPYGLREHALLLVAAATVASWMLLALRERWRELALLCLALVPVALLALASAWRFDYQPFGEFGWLAWPLLFATHLLSLRRLAPLLPAKALSVAHVLGCWLLLGVLALELRYLFALLAEQYNAWRWLGWALVPSAYLLLVAGGRSLPWPLRDFPREYRLLAAAPVALLLLGWFWSANLLSDGAAEPLPYLPLANPLELGLLIVLFALYRWSDASLASLVDGNASARLGRQALAGASLFALLTLAVCRAAHHLAGVPFQAEALTASMLVQAGLSLVWTLCALGLTIAGTRLGRRDLWMVGAALVGVVVVKLFFVELGNSGSLERIISFIGVGVLLLVVGYFSPLPPRRAEVASEAEQP